MKTLFLFSILISSSVFAAIPKASLILQKTTENSGSGFYQIEQEVQFPNGADVLTLKETWLIQSENSMKLIVTGMKELKDQFFFTVTYSNGTRTQGGSNRRLTEEFIEKYFHFRSPEAFASVLAQMKLVPPNVMAKKNLKTLKDVDNAADSFVHLTRTGGVVSYMFGQANDAETGALSPGFWFEQDQFVVRKLRLPSQTEVSADRFSSYARGLSFPRTRTVRWGNNQVSIQTVSVTPKTKESWAKFGSTGTQKVEALRTQAAASLVEEFYKRFR